MKSTLNKITSNKIIELIDFSKSYSRFFKKLVVKNANVSIRKGDFHGFIGPNGAGKTTIIKSIIGGFKNYSGQVIVDNQDIKKGLKDNVIGYIPEKSIFPKNMTCIEYLTQMGMLNDIKYKESEKIALNLLNDLGMINFSKKNPNSFSSGQKQKILLAQSLMGDPKILIMDEPVSNLDPEARNEFFNKLLELNKKGTTIFISSHILSELDPYVNSFTFINKGKILHSGSIDPLKKNDFKTSLKTNNKIKTELYLQKKKIEYKLDKDMFIVSNTNTQEIIVDLVKLKIKIISMQETKNDLWSIYQKILGEQNEKNT